MFRYFFAPAEEVNICDLETPVLVCRQHLERDGDYTVQLFYVPPKE